MTPILSWYFLWLLVAGLHLIKKILGHPVLRTHYRPLTTRKECLRALLLGNAIFNQSVNQLVNIRTDFTPTVL